ncbi:unnamed protein product [Calicophoron daubneyi]|uniref:Ig-like domain-containing protein n=1 Tax=Calicophoron daubneyi TaxID=300641 RepID=A0AAV2TLK9_CALDB
MRRLMDVEFTVKVLVYSGILSIVASIRNVQVQQVTLSSSVFLICRMEINSNSTTGDIWWTKDGKDIFKRQGLYEFIVPTIRDRIRIHDGLTFQLSNVRKADRGLYVCSVPSTNSEAKDVSMNWMEVARIYLDIIEAPTITQHSPERNVVREGSDVTLFCQWTANPRANITWHRGLSHEQLMVQSARNTDVSGITTEHTIFSSTSSLRGIQIKGPKPRISKLKDGHPVGQYPMLSQRYKIHSNGTLQLPNVSRQDAGIYVCQPQTAKNYQNTSPHFATNGSSPLNLLSFNPANSGHPEEEDGLGNKRQASQVAAHVKVKFLPESHMTKRQPIYLGFNGPGRLPCVIYSYPPVQLLEWRKAEDYRAHQHAFSPNFLNQTIPVNMGTPETWSVVVSAHQLASNPERNSHRTTFWYEWDSVSTEDAWKYQCRGHNALGWGQWSESVDVLVKELPKFRRTPPPTLSVAMNSVISLDCEADGDPPPVISWIRTKRINELEEAEVHSTVPQSSEPVSPTHRRLELTARSSKWRRLALPKTSFVTSEGKIRLFVTKQEDIDGIFHCVASNPVGKIVASVNLTILSATVHSKYTATEFMVTIDTQMFGAWLSWDAPDVIKGRLHIDHPNDVDDSETEDCHYVVYHRIVRSGERWKSARVQPDGVKQVWLGGLVPDEWYAFQVTLWCFVNESALTSQVKYAKTDAYRPSPGIHIPNNSPVFADSHPPPVKSDKDCVLPAPDYLQFIKLSAKGKPEEELITGLQWKQSSFEINTSHRTNKRRMDSLQPALHYRVEYKISMSGVKFGEKDTITLSFRPLENALNSWESLSPVEAPKKAYYFYAGPKETVNHNSLFGPFLSAWEISSTQSPINEHVEGVEGVYFRVRSYGLTCASEPSKELEVDASYLRPVLTMLQNTVAHEQSLLQVISLTDGLSDTINKSSTNSPSVIRTPSILELSGPFWHILSFVLLGIVIMCVLGVLSYAFYRSRCLRKPPNFSCANNVLLTNQFQSELQCSDTHGCREAQIFGSPFAGARGEYEKGSSYIEHNKNVSSSEVIVQWNNKLNEPSCTQADISYSTSGQAVISPSLRQSELIYYLPIKNEQPGSSQTKETILWTDSHVPGFSPFTKRGEIDKVIHIIPPVSKHEHNPKENMISAQDIIIAGLPKTGKMKSERDSTERRGLNSCNTNSTDRTVVQNEVWIDCGHDVLPRPGNGNQTSQILSESTPHFLSTVNANLLNPLTPPAPTYVIFPFEPFECPGDKRSVQINYLSYVPSDNSNETPVSSLCPGHKDERDRARKRLWNQSPQASEL